MHSRRTFAVAQRVLRQLRRDRRFLFLSLAAPMLAIYISKAALDAFNIPFFDVSRFVVPLAAFLVHFITYILCAIVLVRERGAQTLARMFTAGFRQTDIIGGYVLAYTCLATLQSLIVLTEFGLLFHLGYAAPTLLAIYLVIWLLAVISISLGILVSNFARTEGQVLPFVPLVTIPGIFLSGLVIPVDQLPRWAQALGHLTPLYYATEVIHGLIAATPAWNTARLTALIAYGAIVLILATRTLRETD
jgi:ABC-2 type transport system permease protein